MGRAECINISKRITTSTGISTQDDRAVLGIIEMSTTTGTVHAYLYDSPFKRGDQL